MSSTSERGSSIVPAMPQLSAIDLFCGAGGLSYGLKQAGIDVIAGVDTDPDCRHPYETNVGATFIEEDVRELTGADLNAMWRDSGWRILAGCAPCQPFSPYRRGVDTSDEHEWSLLAEFGRLVEEVKPDVVTMENVPRVGNTPVFRQFVRTLKFSGYDVDYASCRGPDYGLAQGRRRLVLVASRHGPLGIPEGPRAGKPPRTVRDVIGDLPRIDNGGTDPNDALHTCRQLTEINLERIRASTPGGTWEDWPEELRAPCHRKESGATYRNVYARMEWDKPSPTITTLAHNFGTGRFGHPDQDRPISLREAAMLQGFPRDYTFVADGDRVYFSRLGRLIGNAVPPPLAQAVGQAIVDHAKAYAAA